MIFSFEKQVKIYILNFVLECYSMLHISNTHGWIPNCLGKGVRKLIPSCALWAVHDKFPSKKHNYLNFVENDINIKLRTHEEHIIKKLAI